MYMLNLFSFLFLADNIQKSLSRRTKGSNSFLAALMMPDKSPEISQHPVLSRGRRTISGNSGTMSRYMNYENLVVSLFIQYIFI